MAHSVTIAKQVDLKDPEENLGAQVLREAADLAEAGIIDPTKVVRIALENAVSVASVLLLTVATLTEIPEERLPVPQPAEVM